MYNGQTGREGRSPLFSDSGGGKWGVCTMFVKKYIKKINDGKNWNKIYVSCYFT